jgi:D-alanine-D-alanine ligase
MNQPRVLVIYNDPVLPADHPDALSEIDVLETVSVAAQILEEANFPTRRLGIARDPQPLLDEIRDHRPDVVFNLFEGLADQTETEVSLAALLEWLRVPFTGAPSIAIALGRDKVRTKQLLQGAGLPTPEFQVIESGPALPWPFEWPAIVKPACQDCSVGIDQGSVVTNQRDLEERVALVLEDFGPPVLVEEFVFGRELHAHILEEPDGKGMPLRRVHLPLSEIGFDYPAGKRFWPIYSYDAKWKADSPEYLGTPMLAVAGLPAAQEERIKRCALQAYQLTGLRDLGRIDFRLGEDGRPSILEVNPNPYLHGDGLIDALSAIGRTHPQMIANMIWCALARAGK